MKATKTPETKKIYYANKYLQLGKDFNVLQKRVIHFVVSQLQKEMYLLNEQKSNGDEITRTIFGDVYFSIPIKVIDPTNQDKRIRDALKGLKVPIDDKEFIGDFMLSARRKDGKWILLFPEKTVHFLTEISKGVTPLQTIVYLTAQSKYTIRMYELLMRFRLTGFWYTTPEEFCSLLDLPQTYRNNYAKLKQSVIDVAQKELNNLYKTKQSDITFKLDVEQKGRGNKVNRMKFTILCKDKAVVTDPKKNEDYVFILENLLRIMVSECEGNKTQTEKNKEFIERAMSKLVETGQLKSFSGKLEKKIIQNGKVEYANKGALARYILSEDYGVE